MSNASPSLSILLPNLKGGGAERVMLDLAGYYADRGLSVELLLLSDSGEYRSDVPPNVLLVVLPGVLLPFQLWSLVRRLRRQPPEALVATLIGGNLAAAIGGRLAGRNTRIILREMDTMSHRLKLRHPLTAWLYKQLAKRVYRWADVVIAVSRGVAEDLTRQIPKIAGKLTVIYNPTITPRILSLADKPVEHRWFADGGGPVLLSAGRLEAQKDFTTLLRALALLRENVPARLLLLGQGSQRSLLEAEAERLGIADAVSFEGFQANPMGYMRQADLYVLSSKNEGLPNALLQAMACGCPVVATDCPSGPREILEGGKYGALVPVGDAAALSEAVQEALAAPIAAERLKQRAMQFHIDRIAPDYAKAMGIYLPEQ